MARQESLKCRLCFGRGGRLTNIFSENDDAEQLVREAIEELLELKVVRDGSHPWFICYQCFKILTDFYMFKQQCYENSLILERQTEIKLEEGNISRAKITVKREKIDVEDPEFIEIPAIKDEVDHNIQIQEGTSLEDHLEEAEVNMPSEEEVNIKEDCDTEIPQIEVRLEGEVLQEQDKHKKQDDAGEETLATQLHLCEICYKVFEQRDLLKEHVMNVHLKKSMPMCAFKFLLRLLMSLNKHLIFGAYACGSTCAPSGAVYA
ncbi:uncharacterized protein [Hetaerina americana]|uniref:uncharacterized protein n=1 Tax=Hetaerina americana TaxID=62018 RepID=UPI003A7F2E35